MANFPLLLKPISDLCNLNCSYCFYKDRPTLPKILQKRISLETFKKLVEVYEPFVETPTYIWQGGEPTLLGLPYMKELVSLQGEEVENIIQTNGLLLTREFVEFLKEENWFVGVSLDSENNESRNMDTSKVEEAISLLREYNVPYNILCTVSKENVYFPEKTLRYLSKWATNIQFIPAQPISPLCKGEAPTGPEYAAFLSGIMAEVRRMTTHVSIENFEQAALALYGIHLNCETTKRCGTYLTIESDGNIYPCDFFVEDKWKVGNIHNVENITDFMDGGKMERFRSLKELPNDTCETCYVKNICNKGCPRHRYLVKGDHNDLSMFCEAHGYIFRTVEVVIRNNKR